VPHLPLQRFIFCVAVVSDGCGARVVDDLPDFPERGWDRWFDTGESACRGASQLHSLEAGWGPSTARCESPGKCFGFIQSVMSARSRPWWQDLAARRLPRARRRRGGSPHSPPPATTHSGW
jgi:hypothetical protein